MSVNVVDETFIHKNSIEIDVSYYRQQYGLDNAIKGPDLKNIKHIN